MPILNRNSVHWRICSRGGDELVYVTSLMHAVDLVETLAWWELGFGTSLEHKFFVISNKFEIARVLHPPEMQPALLLISRFSLKFAAWFVYFSEIQGLLSRQF